MHTNRKILGGILSLVLLVALLGTANPATAQANQGFDFTNDPADPLNIPGRGSGYDYAPSAIYEPGPGVTRPYKIWWCAQVPYPGHGWGSSSWDTIHYADSTTPNGPWGNVQIAFSPTTSSSSFDNDHTCDPSVVKSGGKHYLYYGGLDSIPGDGDLTAIGVAVSTNGGKTFSSLTTAPIVTADGGNVRPTALVPGVQYSYGAGQPTVIRANGKFYMVYTDDTGTGGSAYGGIYMLRSTSPKFTASTTQHLKRSGQNWSWQPGVDAASSLTGTKLSNREINVDMVRIPQTKEFLLIGANKWLKLSDDTSSAAPKPIGGTQNHPASTVDDSFHDGYGILRTKAGGAPSVQCISGKKTNPLQFFIASGSSTVQTWDLVTRDGAFTSSVNC